MSARPKREGVYWGLPIPVRVLAVGDKALLETIERRFTPICRFEKAQSIRQADMRMGLASTAYDALVVQHDLPDGNGLEWWDKLHAGGDSARTMIIADPGMSDLPARAAAAGACFVEKSDETDWLGGVLRCFLERVATEHIVRQLIGRFAEERSFSADEHELLEAALWMKCEQMSDLTGDDQDEVDARIASISDKTGLPSVDAAIVAALVRGILESLNGSGFDD